MKTLYIISKGMNKLSDKEMSQLEKKNLIPRSTLLDHAISAEVLDERYLKESPPSTRKFIYSFLPVSLAEIIEALFILKNYDAILSHSEKVGLPLAMIMKYLKIKTPHLVVISRITSVDQKKSRWKMWFLKKTKDSISRFLIWSSMQRDIAINRLSVDSEKLILLKRGIDQQFWKPQTTPTDMICSVGMEARDYVTLVEALRPLSIPCHIAAGDSRGQIFSTIKSLYDIKDLPSTITVGKKKPASLRNLYARSKFVVIPLLPTDSDNGLTCILEAMAMGKAVICTKADGQIDVIQDGITGIYVPQGDPDAMRKVILELWNDPKKCEEIGVRARKYIEDHHNIEQFVDSIKSELMSSINEFESRKTYQLEQIEI